MTEQHYRILFPVSAIYGHLAPALAIAKRLISKGHTVGFCSGSSAKHMLAEAGVQLFYPRDNYQAAAEKTLVPGTYQFGYHCIKEFTPEVLKQSLGEVIDAFEQFKPDVVYIDTMDFASISVAQKYNIPYAHGSATVLFYLEKGIPPMGTGWSIDTPAWNTIKSLPYFLITAPLSYKLYLNQKKAMRRIDPLWEGGGFVNISPYLFMLFSTDKLEYPRNLFIPQLFYVGPSILAPDKDQLPDFPWDKLDENRPLVYIATGTLFPGSYKKFYKNALIALSEENFPFPIQVVMAVGKDQPVDAFGKIPPNFIVVPYAPQLELLPRASVMVTHGGVNSVNETLNDGKPMLVVHMGGDRIDMAERIAYRKAGIRLHAKKATVTRIKEAIIQLLTQHEYTEKAEAIMHSFKACDAPDTAADLIIRLAMTKAPILRKKGSPITLKRFEDLPEYLEKP